MTAMGGQYAELDVISRPLLSGKDFQDRIAGWIQEVKSENVPDQALVVYFSGVKEGLAKQGVDFSSVVGTVCQR